MTKQHAFLVSLLLSHTSLSWGTQIELLDDLVVTADQATLSGRFRITHEGQPSIEVDTTLSAVQTVGFEKRCHANLALNPLDGEYVDYGVAIPRVRGVFHHQNQRYIWEGLNNARSYPIVGEWNFQDNSITHQSTANLLLRLVDGERRIDLDEDSTILPIDVSHQLISEEDEEVAGVRYDGQRAFQIKERIQTWEDPQNTQTRRVNTQFLPSLTSHGKRKLVFIQPFLAEGEALPLGGFIGRYRFERDLHAGEKYTNIDPRSLIYSNGQSLFIPHITQEQWRRDNTLVKFLIASYIEENSLKLSPKAQVGNGNGFSAPGLYQLLSYGETYQGRTEKWARVVKDIRPGRRPEDIITVHTPLGIQSIPGISNFPLEWPLLNVGAGGVGQLQKDIHDFAEHIHANEGYRKGWNRVIVLGTSGAGKSTLIHCLAGLSLTVRGRTLVPQEILPQFSIGHQVGVVGSKKPGSWSDDGQQVVFWDTNGFGDVRGNGQDVINAFGINELFKAPSNTKVVLAVPESYMLREAESGKRFLEIIQKLTTSFPNDRRWWEGTRLVLTHKRQPETPQQLLQGLLDAPQEENAVLSDQNVRDFIAYLNNEPTEPTRVVSFPAPSSLGLSEGDTYPAGPKESILRSVNSATFIPNLEVKITVDVGAQMHALHLAQQLNKDITHFMETRAVQRLRDFCTDISVKHVGTVQALRVQLNDVRERLRQLSHPVQNAERVFINSLDKVFGTPVGGNNTWLDSETIRKDINYIKFLKKLNEAITFNIENWANGFMSLIAQLTQLTEPPQEEFNPQTHVLSLKGMLLGTSDINRALGVGERRQNVQTITGYGFHGLIVDEDITSPGTFMAVLAPFWQVEGNKTFTLKGLDGQAGAAGTANDKNGKPGTHGGNGGHFFGKGYHFANINHLTINTSGGSGGRGGDGATGDNGANGLAGDINTLQSFGGGVVASRPASFSDRQPQVTYEVNEYGHGWQVFTTHHGHAKMSGTEILYTHGNNNGDRGGAGGDGGKEGNGGDSGSVTIEGASPVTQTGNGGGGGNGTGGASGQGGTCGPVVQGKYIAGMKGSYDHMWKNILGEHHTTWEARAGDHWCPGSVVTLSAQTTAPNGNKGTDGANTAGQTAQAAQLTEAQLTNLRSTYLQDYGAAYYTMDPIRAPFVRVFPGIPLPQASQAAGQAAAQ